MARVGIRAADLLDLGILRQKLEAVLREKNQVLVKVYNRRAIDLDEVVEEYAGYAEALKARIVDTRLLLGRALDAGEWVLLEGSQGTLLDVDHGTYPFVTSSNPTAGGAAVGSGIGPTRISRVVGILKAYTTRVGSGPFPTELFDANGEYLRKQGGEVGVTTGRDRRCGWFDSVVARYASRVNGITDFFLTKLDVLSGLETVPICVAYDVDGVRHDEMPMTQIGVPPRHPGLRGDAGLVRGPARLPLLRRAAGERAGLRAPARGALRRADQRDRRRPGTRRERRRPRSARLSGRTGGTTAGPVQGPALSLRRVGGTGSFV